jgi:Fe-S oxidoreductase
MSFEPFVIPFNVGLYFILIYCVARCVVWFQGLSRADKLRMQRGFFGKPFMQSIREIFNESLLHRRIFKVNPVLGYMHMSLAFGWFLLILFGTIEADYFGAHHLNPPSRAIFFRYFNPEHGDAGFARAYGFLMDLLLAIILSGLLLAISKRFRPKTMGMKKTTKHTIIDRVALTSLWLIFPSRLMAESLTCGAYGTGSFLTGNLGNLLASIMPAGQIAPFFWWLYSLSLGTFFVLLPVSRYFHIPVELFLIFMRNSGIKTGDKASSFTEVELHACSSCGICISTCQMSFAAGVNNIQSAYVVKGLRTGKDVSDITMNCLMCGRCEEKCPVGIELGPLRMIQRREGKSVKGEMPVLKQYSFKRNQVTTEKESIHSYKYLSAGKPVKADVLFFAGCMTHLTPSIIVAMKRIFEEAEVNYHFMDEEGGVCCGRPLMLAGRDKEARELINYNSEMIWKSGAKMLVTSCPICYKVFRESYYLDVEVLHHTQFIDMLIEEGALRPGFMNEKVVYHDPCELGRGSGVYDEPRNIIGYVADLQPTAEDGVASLCCGGSIGNLHLSSDKRALIARDAIKTLTKDNPSAVITACPLCKKTFSNASETKVIDIAELVVKALPSAKPKSKRITVKNKKTTSAMVKD